jgi:hypothetical protein
MIGRERYQPCRAWIARVQTGHACQRVRQAGSTREKSRQGHVVRCVRMAQRDTDPAPVQGFDQTGAVSDVGSNGREFYYLVCRSTLAVDKMGCGIWRKESWVMNACLLFVQVRALNVGSHKRGP